MKRRYWQGGIVTVICFVVAAGLFHWSKPKTAPANGVVLGAATSPNDVSGLKPLLPKQLVLQDEPPLPYAGSAVVVDSTTGAVVLGANEHTRVPIASTTKIMSAIVVLSSVQHLDEPVTISEAAAGQIGSVMGLSAGETLSVRDLLVGALLVSGNDAIYALAEHIGGVDSFVNSMNVTAKSLDLKDTQFKDPAGLDDAGYSSAFDLATMFRYAVTFPEFASIIAIPDTTVVSDQGISHHLENSNRLIQADQPLYLSQVIGGKTGFTPDAGHTLVAAASSGGHTYIAAVLHTDEESNDASAREVHRLLTWTFDHAAFR